MIDKTLSVPGGTDDGQRDRPSVASATSGQAPTHARKQSSLLRVVGILVGAYALIVLALGIYWSLQPKTFDVKQLQAEEVAAAGGQPVLGTAVVATAIGVAEALLDKPGGFVFNDVMPPGLYLDNIPNWEYGALKELRDSVRSLRNDFSRSQTQSIENGHLKTADVKMAIDPSSWLLPSAEDEYRQAVVALRGYLSDLGSGRDRSAQFYARADNLAAYLAVVEKRLGSLAVRLSASVGDHELTAALVDTSVPQGQGDLGVADLPSDPASYSSPWNQIDDVFYEARGYTWALLHMMRAIAIDFADILAAKNADVSVQQVVRDLEGATKPMVSPIVLNGHGYGFLANHSLVMASYISRANAAVLDLRILLQQG